MKRIYTLVFFSFVVLFFILGRKVQALSNLSYLTFLFGRSNWVAADNCSPEVGAVTMETAAQMLKTRGISATGAVVTDFSAEDGQPRKCSAGYVLYPTWNDLSNLRDNYGWTFVSQSKNYANMTLLQTDEARLQQSCNTLQTFKLNGHNRAWGLFAYPNDKQDEAAHAIVTKCFAFGRKYGGGIKDRVTITKYPYLVSTASITGGKCNNSNLPCYTMAVKNDRRYILPSNVNKFITTEPDTWSIIQFYRFATGKRSAATGDRWDCSSSDPKNHYTSAPELYCLNDFLSVVDNRPKSIVVTDPATVAEAWKRIPSFSLTPTKTPTPTITLTATPTVTPTLTQTPSPTATLTPTITQTLSPSPTSIASPTASLNQAVEGKAAQKSVSPVYSSLTQATPISGQSMLIAKLAFFLLKSLFYAIVNY